MSVSKESEICGVIAMQNAGKRAGLIVASWMVVAVVFSGFGYVAALRRGVAQPWWPSLGYALAIFSIWALMTWPIAKFVGRIEANVPGVMLRLLIYALGVPVVCAVHVFAFAVLYWPIYNDNGRIATRWIMGERMLLSNLDTNTLLYAVLVGGFVALARKHGSIELQPPDGEQDTPPEEALIIRSRGRVVRVLLSDVDRIQAAGDYSEVHTGQTVHLMDESLTSLAARLPDSRFARVHRSTIVALDRVIEMEGARHGDGTLLLACETKVRLSRRYRRDFEQRLKLR
ncbi:MAG TPA: LytTR family DNA-binding domain-containing protein [Sphingorhabdus sp.]|jgi:hypothetical protein|nr:LytTR family DNA-binding domain-containing protein [Sphingorhabdus sp.]